MAMIWGVTVALFLLSLVFDREKSLQAVMTALGLFTKILPMFLVVLVLTSLSLGFISEKVLTDLLTGRGLLAGVVLSSLAGSVAAIPGFVAFPLAGILVEKGVPYTVIGAFTTTLMMVGVVTFPIEKSFLGTKAALVRNLAALVIAVLVSLAIGLYFGELP